MSKINSSGNTVVLNYESKNYYFQNMKVTYTNKIESTPIIGGGCYRLKTVCAAATITLKARIPFNERLTYLQLIKKLASGKIDNLAIASIGFSDMTLLSGKLTDEENSPFMICEITLTEVSE